MPAARVEGRVLLQRLRVRRSGRETLRESYLPSSLLDSALSCPCLLRAQRGLLQAGLFFMARGHGRRKDAHHGGMLGCTVHGPRSRR
jgi:hypothetical protein